MNYAKKSFRPWMYFVSSQLVPVLTFQNMAVCRVYTVVIICMISSLCLLWHCHFGLAGFQQNRIPTDSGPVEKWRSRGGKFCRWWLGIICFFICFWFTADHDFPLPFFLGFEVDDPFVTSFPPQLVKSGRGVVEGVGWAGECVCGVSTCVFYL